jgi:hypothetical protein
VQFYTASTRKARRFSIALTNLTGHRPALFRFPGGGWAVQEEILSAAAGKAIGRLLACGVRCDRITGPMVLAELLEAGSDRRAWPRHEGGRANSGSRCDPPTPVSSGPADGEDGIQTMSRLAYQYWRHEPSGERYAVRLKGGCVTGCVGPLTDIEFCSRFVVEYPFDASAADAQWAAAERAEFTLLDTGSDEGWV